MQTVLQQQANDGPKTVQCMSNHNHNLLPENQMLSHLEADGREPRSSSSTSEPGNLALKIAAMQKAAASMQIESLPTSDPGPPMRRLQSGERKIPANSGKGGAVARPIDFLPAEQAWQARDSDSLESALYRSLKPVRTSLRPLSDEKHDLVGYELVSPLPPESLPMLRDMAARINEPAGPGETAKMVTRLLTVTKSREPDGIDLRNMIAILAEELAEFPPDVVATACRKWARQEKWWPSLSELRDQCQRATRWRRSLRKALAQ